MGGQLVAADEQGLEALRGEVEHPDRTIAAALAAAAVGTGTGIDDEHLPVRVPDALAAAHAQAALGPALRKRAAEGVAGGDVRIARRSDDAVQIRIGNIDPFQVQHVTDRGHRQVCVGPALGARGLQSATVFQRAVTSAAVVGNEAIEARLVAVVFGQIDVAGARIDRHRLVRETPQGDQGPCVGAFGIGVDLEHVAVLPAGAGDGIGLHLLAGEPCPPRSQAAGAVDHGAPEAGFHAQPFAVAVAQGRGTAAGEAAAPNVAGVVYAGRDDRIGDRPALVVADQHQFRAASVAAAVATDAAGVTATGGHDRHAVVAVGAGLAIGHDVAAPGEGAVRETRRQLQQRQSRDRIGNRRQWSIRTWHRCEPGRVAGGARLARIKTAEAAHGTHGHHRG